MAKSSRPRKSNHSHPQNSEQPVPSMTKEQVEAYSQFSGACKQVYEEFTKEEIDTRITQLRSSPALIMVVRFMVMIHDLLRMYGVMDFNRKISKTLYEHLDTIQEQTGQNLPLARVLLDGIKSTKMETLSGVTPSALAEFTEPEYELVTTKKPKHNPADDELEPPPEDTGEAKLDKPQQTQNVGPGGPYLTHPAEPPKPKEGEETPLQEEEEAPQ